MTITEQPIDPGTAHVIEAAEYVATWPTLPSAEELAEPIIASLYALVLWFDNRAAAPQFSMSEGELVEESMEVIDRPALAWPYDSVLRRSVARVAMTPVRVRSEMSRSVPARSQSSLLAVAWR